MIARNDDTLVCEDCYRDEAHAGPIPAHREAFVRITGGLCEMCGDSDYKEEDHGD